MNRPILGMIVGALIGALDGSSAIFTSPGYESEFAGIIMGSAFKGLVAGLIVGLIVRRGGSLRLGIVAGLVVATALAIPIAIMNANHYADNSLYWKIILPGACTGVMVGYATIRYGKPKLKSAAG